MGWVYAIECVPTKEIYIGATTGCLDLRFVAHQANMRNGRSAQKLQAACDDHGLNNMRLVPIKEFPDAELAMRERQAIASVKPALNERTAADPAKSDYNRMYARRRRGLTGVALEAPPHANKKRYEVRGEMLTAPEIAIKYGLKESTVRQRASSRLDGERIIRGSRCAKPPVN